MGTDLKGFNARTRSEYVFKLIQVIHVCILPNPLCQINIMCLTSADKVGFYVILQSVMSKKIYV